MAIHTLTPRNNPTLPCTNDHSPKPFNTNPIQSLTLTFSLFTHKSLTCRQYAVYSRVYSVHRHNSSRHPSKDQFILETLILCIFSFTLLSLRLISNLLLPDFPHRWNQLVVFSEEAEAKFSHYPSNLWRAIVAYEDRRFFQHCGIDPVGIGRAVLSFSALGGGSTITQQIYWGHGVYGIESASNLYFGKHPSLLSLGECAMLAGIIPAPELRSPFRDSSRGKTFQARVLKRMVEVGFLDIKTAILVLGQSLHLRSDGPDNEDGLLLPVSSSGWGLRTSAKQKGNTQSTVKEIWDWERESKIWEAKENMEKWAGAFVKKVSAMNSVSNNKENIL